MVESYHYRRFSKENTMNIQMTSTKSTSQIVSIIIPVRYRLDLLRVCIDSIKKYTTIPYELILVQEGKDDEITKYLLSREYGGEFIHNEEPKGFAGAMNTGLSIAKGSYYCFLNSDVVVIPTTKSE